MKALRFMTYFVFALTLSLTFCKKDDAAKSAKEILMSKSWKMVSSKLNGVETIEDCVKDDILTFGANGTYTYNVSTILCYEGETSYSGSWTISDDGKTITVDGDAGSAVITESQIVATTVYGTDTLVVTLIPA
jgi:Lipocalin-like domain